MNSEDNTFNSPASLNVERMDGSIEFSNGPKVARELAHQVGSHLWPLCSLSCEYEPECWLRSRSFRDIHYFSIVEPRLGSRRRNAESSVRKLRAVGTQSVGHIMEVPFANVLRNLCSVGC